MSRNGGIAAGWLLLPLLLLLTAQPLLGLSEEELDEQVRNISNQLRCPTCQAVSVNDSDATFSRQIRDKIRVMLKEGQNEEQIKAYFVSRYGEWILRAPKKEGFGLVLWLLPGLAIMLAGLWIGKKAYGSSRAGRVSAAEAGSAPLSESQRGRIERDLKRFEEED